MTQSIQGIKIVPHTFQIDSVLQLQKLNPLALLQRVFPSQKTMKDTSTDGIQLQDLNELPTVARFLMPSRGCRQPTTKWKPRPTFPFIKGCNSSPTIQYMYRRHSQVHGSHGSHAQK